MNLYRVDINLKYLSLQEQPPDDNEIHMWLRKCHEWELDNSFDVELITDMVKSTNHRFRVVTIFEKK